MATVDFGRAYIPDHDAICKVKFLRQEHHMQGPEVASPVQY